MTGLLNAIAAEREALLAPIADRLSVDNALQRARLKARRIAGDMTTTAPRPRHGREIRSDLLDLLNQAVRRLTRSQGATP